MLQNEAEMGLKSAPSVGERNILADGCLKSVLLSCLDFVPTNAWTYLFVINLFRIYSIQPQFKI